jgi:CoA:oxalate CoA-transferase
LAEFWRPLPGALLPALNSQTRAFGEMKSTSGPLHGIRVVSATGALFGPYCGMLLADLGADVIKVERPISGDMSREWGPFFPGVKGPNRSAYFASIHRNQRGITLDLRKPEGREVFGELVSKSDVLIENFRPGTMEAWGLGYASLKVANPRLIYASGSGFGQTGPYSRWPSYDIMGQAMSGFMDLNGWPDKPPARAGPSIGDMVSGMFLTIGILSALRFRESTGRGQLVDVAQVDSMLAILEMAVTRTGLDGKPPTREGSRHPTITPFDIFRTMDGYVAIGAGNDAIFGRLCAGLGLVGVSLDARFMDNARRCENEKALKAMIEGRTSKMRKMEVTRLLQAQNVPSGPVYDVGEAIADEQVQAREMVVDIDQPPYGAMIAPGCPIKFSETPITAYDPAPLLGQHTAEVLEEVLGYSAAKVEKLRSKGVV